jgi:hypothetical protein
MHMATKPGKRSMTDQHKAALAEGRAQGRIVANYLDALEAHRPRRGRKRTIDTVRRQLAETSQQIKDAGGSGRLELIQRRRDLETELDTMQAGGADLPALEREFVKVGKGYAARKGISYASFREFGVPAEVLAKAGINRGS